MDNLTERAKKFLENKREQQAAPFAVGDKLVYRIPGHPEEGPFEVVMVSPDQGGWWALVSKPNIQAWIHQIIVKAIIPKNS